MTAAEPAVVGQRRDGHGIGRSHGAAERAGSRQGHGGQKRVQRRPAGSNDGENEPHGKRRDAPAVFPQGLESTWRDSLKCRGAMNRMSSNSGSMPPFQRRGHRQRERGAEGDLHKRQRQRGRNLSRMLEAMTAVSRNRISSKVSIYTNPGKPCWARAS